MKKQRLPMTRFWQLGAVLLLVSGLLISATVALARPQPPAQPDGVIEHACPDSYEVDDLWTAAKNLSVGAPQAHSFDGNTNIGIPDKDWIKFPVVRTGVYTLTTYDLSAQADTFIKLYDASGNPVYSNGSPVENDDSGAADFGSQIVWTAPVAASGDYYLRVENNPRGPTAYANCAGSVVSYTLSLQSKEPFFIYLPLIVQNF